MTDVVAALIWDGDKFLACQRPAHKARGLLWEFVGGKTEPDETPEEALIRECREELAVTVAPSDVFMEVIHEYPDLTVRLILFNATIADGVPRKLEHNDIRWITTEQISTMQFCPADKDILVVLQNIHNELQARLHANRDEAYRTFQISLIPGIDPNTIMGVRVPVLRQLSKTFGVDQLGKLPHRYYEENILHALSINRLEKVESAIEALDSFLTYVDNWAVCDTLSPRAFRCGSEQVLSAAKRWMSSDHPYTVRFGIAVLMKYFLEDHFSEELLCTVANIKSDHYYVKMMIAWYFATALAKQYEASLPVLEKKLLEDWTHNKTIQKACESYRISPQQKAYLRTLKTERRLGK